jgi:hypothetical protein
VGLGSEGRVAGVTGLDLIHVRDDKIAVLYVFLNPKLA